MTTAWFSLRRHLLVLLLGGLVAVWGVLLVFTRIDAHHEIDELFDAQLAQAAQALLALAGRSREEEVEELGEAAHKYQQRLRFQVWNRDGHLLLRSPNAPEAPLAADDGFSETDDGAGHWRHFTQWNRDHGLQVQVSEDHRIRDELIGHITLRVLLPGLVGFPLLGLWLWVATRRSLSALDGVAAQIARRDPRQLEAVVPPRAPEEIRPLLDSLNDLLHRVDEALEAERRFTADAAHELRTPLAALQAQLQVARRARDEEERERSLAQLQQGLSRSAHLVEQLLQLARLDPERGLAEPSEADLGAVAEAACAEVGPAILAKGVDFELAAAPGARVRGKAEWLQVLVRNLVDNAVRYTPPGGKVRVAVAAGPGGVALEVADSGPGIPAPEREAVLRRFHRIEGSGEEGSGLGLSIVSRIAELHGARLVLGESRELGGLAATVAFSR